MALLMLLDGNSLTYRAFHALPTDLATASGQVTNAVFGFTSMLINLLKDHQPDGIAVAWDRPEPTFRHLAVKYYKSGRSETPDILLQQEIRRRGITVTDEEIVQAAQFNPPPQLLQSPELLTEGRFDPEKYRRFLQSPSARQTGLLAQLEQYYRSEIPRQKLFLQVASDVYVTDQRLWQIYRDGKDSAQVAYVALRPEQTGPGAHGGIARVGVGAGVHGNFLPFTCICIKLDR